MDKEKTVSDGLSYSKALATVKTLIHSGERCLVAGLPGSGKSHFASQLKEFGPILTDKFGAERDKEWVLDVDKIPRNRRLYEGQGKGIDELAKREGLTLLVYMRPTLATFVSTNEAKLKDYSGDNQYYKDYFKEQTLITQVKLEERIKTNLTHFKSILPWRHVIIVDVDVKDKITKGWSES